MDDVAETAKLTWRRYQDGDDSPPPWQEKIFTAGHSHRCPTYVHRTPPCQGSCPSGHDIRGWLAIARGIDKPPVDGMAWQEYAFLRLVEANPFPATMGRVCPAPCEDGCNRNEVEDFVGINAVEQFIGDWALEHGLSLPEPGPDTGKRIAIVGGGPAGLAAAYFLRLMGHACTIFEAYRELGGMMVFGIPGYRIPRQVLRGEIQRIVDMGIEVRTETRVGTDVSVAELEKDFDAIFWGIGATSGRALSVPGAEAPNCVDGMAFLRAFNEGRLGHLTGRVLVIGGGDTAMDVAAVARRIGHITSVHEKDRPENVILGQTVHDVAGAARRQGAEVWIVYRRPISKAPATKHELKSVIAEGVEIHESQAPVEVVRGEDGRATHLKVVPVDWVEGEMKPREDETFDIECDLIVAATGQFGDYRGFEEFDNGRGLMDADNVYQVAGKPGHFVGGDAIKPYLLVTAIGHGRIAAEGVHRHLSGAPPDRRPKVDVHHFNLLAELTRRDLQPQAFDHTPSCGTFAEEFAIHNYEDRGASQIIPQDDLFLGHFAYEARNKRRELHVSADEVLGNFEERTEGLTEEQAVAEGERCMSCGMCFECNNCLIYCPQDAVFRVAKDERALGRYVDTDYTRCIGCHICKDVCPAGYIQMGLGE